MTGRIGLIVEEVEKLFLTRSRRLSKPEYMEALSELKEMVQSYIDAEEEDEE